MKKFTYVIFILSMMLILIMSGCSKETATDKESKLVDQQLTQYSIGQPVPAYEWSLERDLMIKLYNLRNQKVATHTVWRSDYGMIEGDSPSLGYGLPYDTSITNPLQLNRRKIYSSTGYTSIDGVIEQQEPNGVYASKNTTATWIMTVDKTTQQILPLYIEGKVTVYPYPVKVDYDKNRVYRAGKPSTTISMK